MQTIAVGEGLGGNIVGRAAVRSVELPERTGAFANASNAQPARNTPTKTKIISLPICILVIHSHLELFSDFCRCVRRAADLRTPNNFCVHATLESTVLVVFSVKVGCQII